ncbi:MAG: GxxExxY protein [Rhodocyclales bacterium]|nr:GxxExxY protein [Rhodocyclales bacterium]
MNTIHHRDTETRRDALTEEIIGAAIEVHRTLGPGLLESAYEECLCVELGLRSVQFKSQVELPLVYKDRRLDAGYRLDLIVNDEVVVELKSVDQLSNLHQAQLLTYMRLGGYRTGLLLNFNVPVLRDGIRRMKL